VKYQGSIADLRTNGAVSNFVLHVTGGPDVRVQTSQPLPPGTKAGDIVQIEGEDSNDPPFIAISISKVNIQPQKPVPWKWIAVGVAVCVVLIIGIYALTHQSKYYRLELKFNSQYLASTDCAAIVSLRPASYTANPECEAWRIVPVDKVWSRIELKKGGLFLTVPQCAPPAVVTSTVTGANEDCQLWRFVPQAGGWSKLQSKHGNQYLDASYCQPTFGLNPGSTYDGGACQLWSKVAAP
jgi:hypothetical protein